MVRFVELKPEDYKGAVVIVDIDGTVTNDRNHEVDEAAKAQLRALKRHSEVYLCSNSTSTARFWQLAQETDTVYLGTQLRKPDPAILKLIPDTAGKRIVVIGDKQLTDGRFARKIGADFVQVKRITDSADRLHVSMTYAADDLYSYIQLMRPAQWVKNLLVFAPMFFAHKIFDVDIVISSILAFVAFSVSASAVYVMNDLADVAADRQHPRKRLRPIASGAVPENKAVAFVGLLASLLLITLAFVPVLVPVVLVYVALNVAYTFSLKHVAVVDILLVAIFYLLRVDAGGAATGLPLSPWIILCVFFGSLFIIAGKRKGESSRKSRRLVLESYSPFALDAFLVISGALAIISYALYSIFVHTSPFLVYSSIFVTFAIFRMLNNIFAKPEEAESPEKMVFSDRWILASFVAWLAYVFWAFYLVA